LLAAVVVLAWGHLEGPLLAVDVGLVVDNEFKQLKVLGAGDFGKLNPPTFEYVGKGDGDCSGDMRNIGDGRRVGESQTGDRVGSWTRVEVRDWSRRMGSIGIYGDAVWR
jgi:hypothetical protein